MFSFEGEFRRRPTQALGGATRNALSSRDELLREKHDERRRRELERKKGNSVITIQARVRGFLVRRKTAASLRQWFDEATASCVDVTSIGSLISRLFFFYESPRDDERLHKVSEVLLNRSQEVLEIIRRQRNKSWSKRLAEVLIKNLQLLDSNGSSQSVVLPLRLVEIYACPSDAGLWLHLFKSGYFTILKHLIISRCPEVNEECVKAPTPLAESLMSLVKRPIDSCYEFDDKCEVMRSFLENFFGQSNSSSLDCRIFYMVLPIVATCDNEQLPTRALIRSAELAKDTNSVWQLHAFVTMISRRVSTLSEQDVVSYLHVFKDQLIQLLASASDQKASHRSDDASDSEEDMDQNVMERAAIDSLWSLLNREDFIRKIVDGVETVSSLEAFVALSSVIYVMQLRMKCSLHKCPLLCRLAFRPPFLRMLWQTVESFRASDTTNEISVLQTLSSGWRPTSEDAQSFLPLLISFCSLFGLLLPTIYETEFYHEVTADMEASTNSRFSMMPFSLGELASIARQLRDVGLGLVELSFPDSHRVYSATRDADTASHDQNPELWLSLFHNLVQLLHQLYSRDCRKKFADNWIVNTMVFPEEVTDSNLKQPYLKRRPFEYLGPIKDRRQFTNEGPVPSKVELRTTTIIQELPFVIPFDTRVKIFQHLLRRDRQGEMDGTLSHMTRSHRTGGNQMYNIRRNYLYEDAFENFGKKGGRSIRFPL
ncbi:ubiquitin-protein ligase E3C-like, partial [Tropilaelaps mercedesae]